MKDRYQDEQAINDSKPIFNIVSPLEFLFVHSKLELKLRFWIQLWFSHGVRYEFSRQSFVMKQSCVIMNWIGLYTTRVWGVQLLLAFGADFKIMHLFKRNYIYSPLKTIMKCIFFKILETCTPLSKNIGLLCNVNLKVTLQLRTYISPCFSGICSFSLLASAIAIYSLEHCLQKLESSWVALCAGLLLVLPNLDFCNCKTRAGVCKTPCPQHMLAPRNGRICRVQNSRFFFFFWI